MYKGRAFWQLYHVLFCKEAVNDHDGRGIKTRAPVRGGALPHIERNWAISSYPRQLLNV